MTEISETWSQVWDRRAQRLRDSQPGEWVLVQTVVGRGAHAEHVRAALERRLQRQHGEIEITTRRGRGPDDPTRPWVGWRIYARRIEGEGK